MEMLIFSKTILKTIAGDLWLRKGRSITIIISISMVVAFPVSFLNSGPTLTHSLADEASRYNLSQLEIFFGGINSSTVETVNKTANSVAIEPRIRGEGQIVSGIDSGDAQQIYYLSLPSSGIPNVNIPQIVEGTFSGEPGSCAVITSFSRAYGIEIGDMLQIKGKNATKLFSVSALINSVEFMSYSIAGYGYVFLTHSDAAVLEGLPFGDENNDPTSVYNDLTLCFEPDEA